MGQPGITFEGVWKRFCRTERHTSLRDLIPVLVSRAVRGEHELKKDEFWAIRDVTLDARRGEALGIIGPNGAEKSTVLKPLTKILRPTEGRCELRGRVGALIEVSAGFHPDLTGRENIYLQGAIMGMKRVEIDCKFDAIVEFSGIPDFLETPVRRYFSGMNARLGFSIAAHLEPEVLIVDEVLSVGDFAFQQRAYERLQEMVSARCHHRSSSRTSWSASRALCKRAVLLRQGRGGARRAGDRDHRRLHQRVDRRGDSTDRPTRRCVIRGVGAAHRRAHRLGRPRFMLRVDVDVVQPGPARRDQRRQPCGCGRCRTARCCSRLRR